MNRCKGIVSSALVLFVFAVRGQRAEPATLERAQTIELKGEAGEFDQLALDA